MKPLREISFRLGLGLALLLVQLPAAADEPNAYQRSYDLEVLGKHVDSLGALDGVPAAQQGYVYALRRAWLLHLLGRSDESIASYRRAAAAAPAAIEPLLGVMLPQMALRRWSDVEATALEVLRREPMSYLGNSRLAWAQYNLGKYADAMRAYQRLVVAYPSDVEMRVGLGWALLKQGKGAEAASHFREVLAIAPRHATAREGLLAAGVPR